MGDASRLTGLGGDLRLAVRRLVTAPLFTLFAVLSVGIGVALTTAAYSVVDSLFLRELHVPDPDTLVFVVQPGQGRLLAGTLSEADLEALRDAQTSLGTIASTTRVRVAVTTPASTERLGAEVIDGAYFSALGVTAALGRVITAADVAQRQRVVVLSTALWRSRFGSDQNVIGQPLRINGDSYDIVGVMPSSFDGINAMLGGIDVWIPRGVQSAVDRSASLPAARGREDRSLAVFGRLPAPGPGSNRRETLARVAAEVSTIALNLDATAPRGTAGSPLDARNWTLRSVAAIADEDTGLRRFGLSIVALIAMVLVVACTNLSNLVLARGASRQRDLAVRRALGASRWRLVREQMLESALLAVLGGLAAYAVFAVLRVLMHAEFRIGIPGGGGLRLAIAPLLDLEATSLAVAALLASLIVFGLEPAWQLTRAADLRGALAVSAGTGIPRGPRQRLLLRWQVAVAAGFFIIATMFVKYTVAHAQHDPGVDLDRLGVALLTLDSATWEETRARDVLERVLADVSRDPAVAAAAVSAGLPFGAPGPVRLALTADDGMAQRRSSTGPTLTLPATPAIFATLGVAIVRGRAFDERDHAGAEPVVVLSELAARRLFNTVDAVGRTVQSGTPPGIRLTVIGVARDTDVGGMLAERQPLAYVPFAQRYVPAIAITVRAAGDAGAAVQALRQSLRRVDPDLAVDIVGRGNDVLAGPLAIVRALGLGALALGGVTLVLAMGGLFGIQSHVVTNRTREIGVRISMGATPAAISRMVLRDGVGPVLDGLAYGLIIGLAGRAIARAYLELEDVVIFDMWMLGITPLPLLLAGLCACYLPARRAAAVDPTVALRGD